MRELVFGAVNLSDDKNQSPRQLSEKNHRFDVLLFVAAKIRSMHIHPNLAIPSEIKQIRSLL
jgi:hypothetical protein